MSKIVFGSYTPGHDAETQERKQSETKILRQNLKLIMENAETILTTPRYFFCQLTHAYLGTYLAPSGPIPLGVLVTLWKQGTLLDPCDACGGTVHIIGAGGSVLSGDNRTWGYCASCGVFQGGDRPSFMTDLYQPIWDLCRQYPNRAIIQRTARAAYDWKGTKVEKNEPDRVIKPRIEAIPIEILIEELKQPWKGPPPQETDGVPSSLETPVPESDVAAAAIDECTLEEPGERGGEPQPPPTLIATGLRALDTALSGGIPSGAVTWLASPWREDTRALMLAIAGRHLMSQARTVAYGGWERREDVLACLAKGRLARKNLAPLARANSEERAAYKAALQATEDDPFCFVPMDQHTHLDDVAASVRLAHESHPLGIVLISDLWAVRDFGNYPPGPAVAGLLRDLAHGLGVPVVVALQPRGEPSHGSLAPLTLAEEETQQFVRPDRDACLLLSRLSFGHHCQRDMTMTVFVEAHLVAGRGGLVHYDFDHYTKTLHEKDKQHV